MIQNLLVVGGDVRMEQTGHMLKQCGYDVDLIRDGMDEDWKVKMQRADLCLLPYPYAVKDGKIPGWEHGGVAAEELLSYANSKCIVMTGNGLKSECDGIAGDMNQLKIRKYSDDPLFVQRNAEISAEAAVYECMQRMPQMLDEVNVLVLGYGLFARAIVWRLKALGARVWVAARREKSRLQAMGDGAQAVDFGGIAQLAPRMQVVMNTVPAIVLGKKELSFFADNALLMELASPPYGIDLSAAVAMEKNVVVLPGLPSRYAPISAARALKEAVLHQIQEARI